MKRIIQLLCLLLPLSAFALSDSQLAIDCGKQYKITATPQEGYRFVRWTDGETDNPRTLTALDNRTFAAVFEKIETGTIVIDNGEDVDLEDILGDNPDIIIEPGGELNINASGISIGALIISADGVHSGEVHHGELPISAQHIYLEYILNPWGTTANPNRWYAFAVPFEVDLNGGISRTCDSKPLVSGTDFLILEYNGLLRALQGKGWSKKLTGSLEPGNFYMIGIDGNCNRWRFEKKAGQPVQGSAHVTYDEYYSSNPLDKGWNGMGNTQLEYSGMNMGASGITYMVTYNNRYGKYETHRIDEMNLFVGQPFFIQTAGEGSFDFHHYGPSHMPALYATQATTPMMHFTLTDETQSTGTDHMYLTLHEGAVPTYTIGRDVARMSTDCKTAAQLWCTMLDGTQLSAHGISIPETEISVNIELFAPAAGEYSLDLDTRSMDCYEVELLHNGVLEATFGAQPVTLNLNAGTNSGYSLRISRKAPTSLEGVQNDKAQSTKVLIDGHLYILRAGHMYDAQGKKVQ